MDTGVSASQQRAFLAAAAQWGRFGALEFVPHTGEPDYVMVMSGEELGIPLAGVLIWGYGTTGSAILGNTIYENTTESSFWGGIELYTSAFSGSTPPDPFDNDEGPNDLQSFPTLTTAEMSTSRLALSGHLSSMPEQSYRIEFFLSPQAHPSGSGDGRFYIGFLSSVTTNASGYVSFETAFPAFATPSMGIGSGWIVTSTATHLPTQNTSEFSFALPIRELPRTDGNDQPSPRP